jgi:hypothetical protein
MVMSAPRVPSSTTRVAAIAGCGLVASQFGQW